MRVDEVRALLAVDKHRLDDEFEIHADIADRIGQEVTRAARGEAEAKDRLAVLEARLGAQYRREAETKLTKDEVESLVLRDAERGSAFRAYQDAIADHSEWKTLRDAWKDKGYSIKGLSDLFGESYFALRAGGRSRSSEPDMALRAALRDAPGRTPLPTRRRAE